MLRLRILLIALLGLVPAAAQPLPSSQRLTYVITRGGDPIGAQTTSIETGADGALLLRSRIRLEVRILGLSAYVFAQDVEEKWAGDVLQSLTSVADDDGDARTVELKRSGDSLLVLYNGKRRSLPGDALTASFLHPELARRGAVLEPLKGRMRQVSVTDHGTVELALPLGRQRARHYTFSGELNRDVWYGEDGSVLAAQMTAKDGSIIRQELQARQ